METVTRARRQPRMGGGAIALALGAFGEMCCAAWLITLAWIPAQTPSIIAVAVSGCTIAISTWVVWKNWR